MAVAVRGGTDGPADRGAVGRSRLSEHRTAATLTCDDASPESELGFATRAGTPAA
jgi:hypothetical protein